MLAERRAFLRSFLPAALALWGAPRLLASQARIPGQRPKPEAPEDAAKPDPHAILKENEKDIRRDVGRLAQLAEELKKEVEKTDSSEVLSLQLVRKTEEIEKLAKRIRNLARG
jgi:hypothetical protein